jgi:hypothetical protein
MRYLLVYFQKKIVDGLAVYVYTTRKSMRATVNMNGTQENFSVTFWDGKPKEKSEGTVTMWLNDKNRTESLLYAEVYGEEAVLAVNADNELELMSIADFNALPKDEQNLVQPSVFA